MRQQILEGPARRGQTGPESAAGGGRETIDSEIEEIKKQGGSGPWYSATVISKAFNIHPGTVHSRTYDRANHGFQGSLPEVRLLPLR